MPLKVNQMGDILLDTVEELTAMDVYDLAADIGKECEKLIHTVGTESMSDLIKKVIVVLEILEAFTTKNERTEQEFLELTKKINQLEAEKQTKAENRRKFEKEVETVEEELVQLVNRLQVENKRLLAQGSSNAAASEAHPDIIHGEQAALDAEILLKSDLEKCRKELRRCEEELEEKTAEVESLQIEIEQFKAKGVDAKRYQRELQAQIRSLCEERTNLMSQIQDQSKEIVMLKQELGVDRRVPKPKPVISEPEFPKEPAPQPQNPAYEEDEPPVQGPLPYEPDDAPWKRREKETGIRKFFRQLFLDPGKSSFSGSSLANLSSSLGMQSTANY